MLDRLIARLRRLTSRERSTDDLAQEMRLHRELRAESLRAQGKTADDAAREARRRFGSPTAHADVAREPWGWQRTEHVLLDLRQAVRRLRARPGFSAGIIVILALGIGATTAMFSAVDAALLRPLPFAEPSRLVTLDRVVVPTALTFPGAPPRPRMFDVDHLADMQDVVTHVGVYASGGLNLADPTQPRRVKVGVVSSGFFATLGVPPAMGRTIVTADVAPGAPGVVVLSWNLWMSAYGGADVRGTLIPLNTRSYEVVGVMPQGFSFPGESDLWIPMAIPTTAATFEPFRGFLPSVVMARLAPGVSTSDAEATLQAAYERVASRAIAEFPAPAGQRHPVAEWLAEARAEGIITPLRAELVGDRQRALLVLFGITAILLLVVCSNIMSLMVAQGFMRGRELAVRTALGASRGRIVRQLLAESLVLSMLGAALGLAVAPLLLGAVGALMPAALSGLTPAQLDLRVLGFAVVTALGTSLLFGLWPAFRATRGSVSTMIQSGGGHGSTASGARRLQRVLVAAELGFACMLLIGAGLMLRSFERLVSTDVGFATDRIATLELSFARGVTLEQRAARLDAIGERLRAEPGVLAAGSVNDLPLRGAGGIGISVTVEGAPESASRTFPRMLVASDGYFETMGIAVRRGRTFTPRDGMDSVAVAVISEGMARAFWPELDPIGRTFLFGGREAYRVIGVVADVREAGVEREPGPQMYFPMRSNIGANAAVVARGASGPALLSAMTRAVRSVDPSQAIYNLRTMDEVIGASTRSRRANTLLIGAFGALGLLIAAVGVYAVLSNLVTQRGREFGIRAALGATPRDVMALVGREVVFVAAVGLAAGTGAAWAAARVMAGLVYGVEVRDTLTFVVAPAALLVATLVASAAPVRRAMRVEAGGVLRAD
jgi:putative ABC transport system permease protein